MSVRHRHEVLLAARQERERGRALQDGGRGISIEFGFRKNGRGNCETLLTVRHEKCRYWWVMRHLEFKKINTVKLGYNDLGYDEHLVISNKILYLVVLGHLIDIFSRL